MSADQRTPSRRGSGASTTGVGVTVTAGLVIAGVVIAGVVIAGVVIAGAHGLDLAAAEAHLGGGVAGQGQVVAGIGDGLDDRPQRRLGPLGQPVRDRGPGRGVGVAFWAFFALENMAGNGRSGGSGARGWSLATVRRMADPTAEPPELRYELADGVARLTIDRPARRNALSWTVLTDLRARLAEIKDDPEARVVVLTGAGDRAFCAGADLTGMADGAGHLDLHDSRGELAALFGDLWDLGKPTIARVRGYALAGGMGLALACDLVVAADDAVFGTPEIDVGLWPYMITVPMVRSMPPKKALELMMTGRRVDAAEADRIGFVTRVVPAAELDAAVDELAATLASKSPATLRLGRQSFYEVWDRAADEALPLLHALLTVTTGTDDAAEGIAAFVEKRRPEWTGR